MRELIPRTPPALALVKGEVRREAFGHRLFVLKLVNCGSRRCKKCGAVGAHGPYWYEIRTNGRRNFWDYRGRHDAFSPHEFVSRSRPNHEHESEVTGCVD